MNYHKASISWCLFLLYRLSSFWKYLEAEVPLKKQHLILLDYPVRQKEPWLISWFIDESSRGWESWEYSTCQSLKGWKLAKLSFSIYRLRNQGPEMSSDLPTVTQSVGGRVRTKICFQSSALLVMGFPHSSVGKEPACNAGDPGSIPQSGRSTGEGTGYPLQYSWASLWLSW